MSPNASEEFLKAHCVISRSWALAQLRDRRSGAPGAPWTDASAHTHYDVCNDDHCQRYHGIGAINAAARSALAATRGEVLWSERCAGEGWDGVTRGVAVADLDGDGRRDVASLAGNGLLRVFRGRDGALLYEFDARSVSEKPLASSSHGVTIADLTGDGKLDVFFVVGATRPESHGLAVCLSGFRGKGPGWYMLRHDPRNSGNVDTELEPVLLEHIENLEPTAEPVMKPPPPGARTGRRTP